jgi:hypothetical protein
MVRQAFYIILIGLIFFTLLGCFRFNGITPTPGSDPIPSSNWTIQLHRTGGYVGVDDTLTLNSTGELTVRSVDDAQEIQSTLPSGELARIQGLLQQTYPFTGPERPSDCRDCFTYSLDIQWDTQSYLVQMDDLNIPVQMAPLLDALIEILQAALAG